MKYVTMLLVAFALAACNPRSDATPMPTKHTTIDRVERKLDQAAEDAARRRAQFEAATQ